MTRSGDRGGELDELGGLNVSDKGPGGGLASPPNVATPTRGPALFRELAGLGLVELLAEIWFRVLSAMASDRAQRGPSTPPRVCPVGACISRRAGPGAHLSPLTRSEHTPGPASASQSRATRKTGRKPGARARVQTRCYRKPTVQTIADASGLEPGAAVCLLVCVQESERPGLRRASRATLPFPTGRPYTETVCTVSGRLSRKGAGHNVAQN